MANTYLSRTPSSAGNRQTWTISAWIKRGALGSYQNICCSRSDANNAMHLCFDDVDRLFYQHYLGSSVQGELKTNRKFRDLNCWYNVVITFDSTNGTAGDRQKMYINGVEETSFATDTNIGVNQTSDWNDISNPMYIGQGGASNNYWTGSMSYVAFIDGTAEAPGIFGETDSTTGEWKIKTSITPSSGWGTNGFLILKDGNTGTDQSTNSNNFAVGGGTLTKTEDCPSNVFATLNPLDIAYTSNLTVANGNNTTNQTSNWGDYGIRSTLAATTGKYYWEAKIATSNTLCILPMETRLVINLSDGSPADDLYGVQRYSDSTTNIYDDGTFTQNSSTMWGGITSSDIISFALDLDNGKLFLAKNGAYKNQSGATGDPVNGTNPTFTISDTTKTYGFYTEMRGNDNNGTIMNFGNGYFGTTAVSSAGTNASGIGIFEYDVPTGYTALSTKGLNQ